MTRYGQPTRARDVLRHITLVDLSGDPSPNFVERVRRIVETPCHTRSYAEVAQRMAWHEGGPGDLLRKALVLAETQRP